MTCDSPAPHPINPHDEPDDLTPNTEEPDPDEQDGDGDQDAGGDDDASSAS